MKKIDKPLFEIKDLSIRFQTQQGLISAVENLSFAINPGETVALVGESGSGKSISALAIMQLLPETARVSQQSQIFFSATRFINSIRNQYARNSWRKNWHDFSRSARRT